MAIPYEEWRCAGCGKTNAERNGVDSQYSLGIYAGRYHEDCWQKSGFRKEGKEGYSYEDAGEYYEADEY